MKESDEDVFEDPNCPFYGLTDSEKDNLMAAIMNQAANTKPSKIKVRRLPSRKDPIFVP